MIICETKAALRAALDDGEGRAGFVPTMGALHEGHLSLVDIAKKHSNRVIVSIFVNPAQFAPHEDFDAYPRDIAGDAAQLKARGADILYTPSEEDIYPDGQSTDIKAGDAAAGLETDFRPHFFDGVVNVVARLFGHVRPDIAVFGEKDFQQLQVIREMVKTHNMGTEIIGGPIIRDTHGLALSSRNEYLSAEELAVARQLNNILRAAATSIRAKTRCPSSFLRKQGSSKLQQPDFRFRGDDEAGYIASILEETKNSLLNAGFDKVDYVETRWSRILAAAWLGKTRLIDNIAP